MNWQEEKPVVFDDIVEGLTPGKRVVFVCRHTAHRRNLREDLMIALGARGLMFRCVADAVVVKVGDVVRTAGVRFILTDGHTAQLAGTLVDLAVFACIPSAEIEDEIRIRVHVSGGERRLFHELHP